MLVWLAPAPGLSAMLGYLDRVLLPLPGSFVAVLLVGLLRGRTKT
ncbi:mercury resistance system transport protein MerF [Denitromonas sp.]|nr:mercury resistance system transport protein MerF [Denitromonas sp.]